MGKKKIRSQLEFDFLEFFVLVLYTVIIGLILWILSLFIGA